MAAGVGFVAVGGPRRLFRRAKRAVVGPEEPLPESMLPDEIEKSLKRLGTDGVRVRGLLEREFADYLQDDGEGAREPRASRRRDRDAGHGRAAVRPRCRATAREQVFTPDAASFQEQLDRIRARRAPHSRRRGGPAEADALAEADAEIQGI